MSGEKQKEPAEYGHEDHERYCEVALEAVRAELGGRLPTLAAAEGLWLAMQMLVGPQAAATVIDYCSVRGFNR